MRSDIFGSGLYRTKVLIPCNFSVALYMGVDLGVLWQAENGACQNHSNLEILWWIKDG